MKRLLKFVVFVVALIVAAAVVMIGSVFLGRQSPGDGVTVNGIRILRDGFVSVAVIPLGPQQVALVDAGNDSSGRVILTDLSRSGLGPEAVTAILLTHGHPDHIGAVAMFPKAQVMALAQEVPLIEGRVAAVGPLPRLLPVRPTGIKVTRSLRDGDTVTLGQTAIRVYTVPGHTGGSAAYLVNDTLFLGDAADAGSDGAIQIAPWIFTDSQDQDRASLIRLYRKLDQDGVTVKSFVFGHSGVLNRGILPLKTFATRTNP